MGFPTPPPLRHGPTPPTRRRPFCTRLVCRVPAYPPLRMPGTAGAGAYVIDACELDPSGALTALTATWHERLTPDDTGDGEVVLQLLAPSDGDPDRTDVRVWIARGHRWHPVGRWNAVGPDWLGQVAPVIAAAIPPRRTR